MGKRAYSQVIEKLRRAGMRPTSQRLGLAKILFENGHRHVTAEALFAEANACSIPISLATVYNSLNQFTQSGLLREIIVDSQRCYFDTNTSDHHHFFCERTNTLKDIPFDDVILSNLPDAPEGKSITRVDVILRVS